MSGVDERILGLLKDARRELELGRQRRTEPIAVVGMSCRFPSASSVAEFWRLLQDGIDAIGNVPADRFDVDSLYDPDPDAPGKVYVKRGGFLERIDGFDPGFFGISPREAVGMDPQHRLLLEVTWEALEDAGIPASELRGSETGIWIGSCLDDYARRGLTSGDLRSIDPYNALGSARSIAAGRLAYVLDLKGPVVQLDTACSSSLVAVHQACQSLRLGESKLAIVGGVNLMSSPETTVALCRLRALSPDGRCKTFDDAADGYGRGEGCGVVVLMRLSDAVASQQRIYSVIRGSAMNHDGRSNGLTAPNGLAQEAVIHAALASAGLEPAAVDFVEAHGTGTHLGDPIEVLALSRVYGQGRAADDPLYLGAVKTNIGHLEGAAGVASLIKVALSLYHGSIPANLNFQRPNSRIPWEQLAVRVATRTRDWPKHSDRPRVGALSSFGLSGTNVHALLAEPPSAERVAAAPARRSELVVLSAKRAEALPTAAARLRAHLDAHPEVGLGDLAYSLATTRSLLESRLALRVSSRAELEVALRRVERGEEPAGGPAPGAPRGKVAWLFTGQGAQTLGMGRELHAEWPAFREALEAAFAAIDPLLERPLAEVMWASPGSPGALLLDQTGYTQPALFALEWALAALWRSFGVEPDMVCGHSIGELTAACVAGVFSLPDAARLVCARARLMQALPAGGAMVSISASEVDVAAAVKSLEHDVAIAAVNGRASTVISGLERHVLAVAESFAARGVDTRRLSVSHAFHSPLMDPMLEKFLRVAESVEYRSATIPLISNVSGELASGEIGTARYWADHVRRSVRFARSVEVAYAAGARTFIEIGPRPALLGLLPSTIDDPNVLVLASLRPGRPESPTLMDAAARWIVQGGRIDWASWFPGGGRRVELPTYGWERQRYWSEAAPPRGEAGNEPDVAAALRRLSNSNALSDAARAQLPAILEALSAQRASLQPSALHEPFYAVEWQPIEATAETPIQAGTWVVVGDARDAREIGQALERAGKKHRLVADSDGLREVLAVGAASGVIHVLGENEDAPAQVLAVERALASTQQDVCGWWITRGAVGVTPEERPQRPGHAVVWGLCRTFALEHPRTWGGIIDAPGGLTSERADQIARHIRLAPSEDQLAIRGSGALAMRLVRQQVGQGPRPAIEHGTCLVTGGLGGLGLHVARWLARRGARHLVLTGRKGISTPGAPEAVAELEALGARVRVVAVDVTDTARMTELLKGPLAEPLTAIFHVAGVNDTTPLEALTAERLDEVLASKREGTRLLDELTRDLSLQAFVCFSSIAGVWGSGSQAAYAASNAFLDAWAHAARADGRPALAISWGPWRGQGLASGATREYLERRGLRPLAPETALEALEIALSSSVPHCVVADMDWSRFRAAFEAWRPRAMLRDIDDPNAAAPEAAAGAAAEAPLIAAVKGSSPADRSAYLRRWLTEQASGLLGHREVVALDVRRGLFDLGMDSLMLVELRRRLEHGIGRRIAPGVVFSHPNIAALTDYLLTEIAPDADAAQPAEGRSEPAPEVEALERDEDVLRFINDRFEDDDG